MQSIEGTHLHAWIEPMRNAGKERVSRLGPPTDCLLAFNGSVCELHFDLEAWTERGRLVMQEVSNDPEFLAKVASDSAREVSSLRQVVEKIASSAYKTAPPEVLAESVITFFGALKSCHLAGLPIVILETRHELWTNHVRGVVARALERAGRPNEELASAFSLLSTPARPSSRVREKLTRSKLYEKARRNDKFLKSLTADNEISLKQVALDFPLLHQELEEHSRRFGWITYMYSGPGWESDHFLQELATMAESNTDPQDAKRRLRQNYELRQSLEVSLGLTVEEERAVALTRYLMYVKDARKDATYFAFARTEDFWRDVSERLKRPLALTRMLLPEEITFALQSGVTVPDEAALNDRLENSALQYRDGEEHVLLGRVAAQGLSRVIAEEGAATVDGSILKGTCAVPGKVRGKVRIVNSSADGRMMEDGQILVSVATDPSLEPAMSRAAGIVTDMGGITCHAAIVSRELGIPCVVGTRFASKVLKDGELVEVDATGGVVRRLES